MAKNYNGVQINPSATIVEKAGATIADVRNRIVKFDENGNVVLAAAGTDIPVGIAIIEAGYNDISGVESGKVNPGERVDILIKEMGVVLAGDTIKKGQEVTAGADGEAVAAAGGDYVLGFALDNAEAGEFFIIQIAKYRLLLRIPRRTIRQRTHAGLADNRQTFKLRNIRRRDTLLLQHAINQQSAPSIRQTVREHTPQS